MGYVIPTVATAVGATVSSAVYMSMTATGEFSASLISRSIGLTGTFLGAGAGYFFGSVAGATVKAAGFVAEAVAKPALDASSKSVAMGTSLVAGAVAVAATAAVAEGGKFLYGVASGLAEKYLPAAPSSEESQRLLEDTLEGVTDMMPSIYIQSPHGKMKLGAAVDVLKQELTHMSGIVEIINEDDLTVVKLLEDTDKYNAEGMAVEAAEPPVTVETPVVAAPVVAAPVEAPTAVPEKKHKQKHK